MAFLVHNSMRVDEGKKGLESSRDENCNARTVRSGEEREVPTLWHRISVTTTNTRRKERETKGKNDKRNEKYLVSSK